MDFIGVHLNECTHCRGEYQSLLDTKRLLASLAHRSSRAEIESLLKAEEGRFADYGSGSGSLFRGALRPKPLAATVVLSLAGLWIASASLDSPTDGVSPGAGGIPAANIASVSGFGMGMRSLRYLNDTFRSASSGPTLVPVSADTLVMSPGSPYPVSVPSETWRYRPSVSLGNVIASTTGTRVQMSTIGAPVTISIYTVSDNGSDTYSVSVHQVRQFTVRH